MEDIKIGYIYKLVDNTNSNVYYGSTMNLKKRLRQHKEDYKKYLKSKCHYKSSFEIIKNSNWLMLYLEVVPFKDISLLRERERSYIENNQCINKYIPNRSKKEYFEDNKEHLKNIQREWWNIKKVCDICKYEVSHGNMSRHLKSTTHIDNESKSKESKLEDLRHAIDFAIQDWLRSNDISEDIISDLDYSFIDDELDHLLEIGTERTFELNESKALDL
jgi:hypothetical protein